MRALLPLITALGISAVAASADAKILVTIDKSAQRMSVSVDDERRHHWPISTGRAGHDTPGGSYRAFRMEKDHYSREWDNAPMPHSIFFTKTGHAIHGSYETKKLGSPASAGCVRLAPENAEKLFALVKEHGVLNTTVEVTGDIRVALGRRTPQAATGEDDRNFARRGYGASPGHGPRYRETQPYYGQAVPYGEPRRPPYWPPPGYHEPQPYPRYYRW
jgi:hypothetical protein